MKRRTEGWEGKERRAEGGGCSYESRAPQCLSVLRMDITFDETDSTCRYWHFVYIYIYISRIYIYIYIIYITLLAASIIVDSYQRRSCNVNSVP